MGQACTAASAVEPKKASSTSGMGFPTLFVNHGGGPLPLLGRQEKIVEHMKDSVAKWLPERPKCIVVFSAHWESKPVKVTSAPRPELLFDYSGFPKETYEYSYPAPGAPELAMRICKLIQARGIECELDGKRGYDHGVFVPLMVMYPEADIPVVCVSLHGSLSAKVNMELGAALAGLREEGILILGSGYTFHNMEAFFHPSEATYKASQAFNDWLKATMLSENRAEKLLLWEKAPGARACHPREEHLLPLLVAAAAGGATAELIFEVKAAPGDHAISAYRFQ